MDRTQEPAKLKVNFKMRYYVISKYLYSTQLVHSENGHKVNCSQHIKCAIIPNREFIRGVYSDQYRVIGAG